MKGSHVQAASAAMREKFLKEKPAEILDYADGGRGANNWLTLYAKFQI